MTSLDDLSPTGEQMAMLAAYPDDKPFVMVNLLKYKGAAGAERYLKEYEPAVRPIMQAAGGRDVWKGKAEHLIIGAAPHDWDAVWLVSWPSKAAFFAMVTDPGFAATQEIRVASLDAITLLLSSEYP